MFARVVCKRGRSRPLHVQMNTAPQSEHCSSVSPCLQGRPDPALPPGARLPCHHRPRRRHSAVVCLLPGSWGRVAGVCIRSRLASRCAAPLAAPASARGEAGVPPGSCASLAPADVPVCCCCCCSNSCASQVPAPGSRRSAAPGRRPRRQQQRQCQQRRQRHGQRGRLWGPAAAGGAWRGRGQRQEGRRRGGWLPGCSPGGQHQQQPAGC